MIAEVAVGAHQATLDGLAPYRVEADAGAVVGEGEEDVAALAADVQADRTVLRLARRAACLAGLDAVVHGVAQHVLQRRDDAFEDGTIHLAVGVADHEFDLLAKLAGHLPDDPPQTRYQPIERHHAGAHQAFLEFGVDPRLLQQQGLRVTVLRRQGFLQVEKVGGRFEECARELLQLRIAVHFQRVEFFVAGAFGIGLVAREDLRLSLGVEAAQLVAHPLDGGLHLAEGEADVAHLLLDPAAEDRGLARQVDQVLQQFRRHLHQFLRGTPGSGLLGRLLGLAHERQGGGRGSRRRRLGRHDRAGRRGQAGQLGQRGGHRAVGIVGLDQRLGGLGPFTGLVVLGQLLAQQVDLPLQAFQP